jgi:quercetin dioxygenase-like cupin family protein
MANTMRAILRGLAAQTMRQIAGIPPEQIYSLDVRLRSGESLRVPLLEKTWVQYLPSLSLMLIRSGKEETEFLMDVTDPAFLPWHSHTGTETVTVIRGSMVDLTTARKYLPGETWEISAEQWHRAQFDAGTLCRVLIRPPLETAALHPIDLSHMEQAFAYEDQSFR